MTASYTRVDKTCDKVDAQIWVVYYAFRDKFTHPFIKVRPRICGTNRELCSCQIWEKKTCGWGWSSESEPSFQKTRQLPAGAEVNNKMADVRVEGLSRCKCLLRII